MSTLHVRLLLPHILKLFESCRDHGVGDSYLQQYQGQLREREKVVGEGRRQQVPALARLPPGSKQRKLSSSFRQVRLQTGQTERRSSYIRHDVISEVPTTPCHDVNVLLCSSFTAATNFRFLLAGRNGMGGWNAYVEVTTSTTQNQPY
ncbi:hypothetical protein GWK47_000092 [Chionoecetes opilio]|uniref:Uncharacterized protein n=1 Tax=Chionoecetes opilio TaxID=41210 RepID=A0A8J4Y250_CHIOP|nr:hypothetical protein GWK47_000092 [Chionoecetes opilio]